MTVPQKPIRAAGCVLWRRSSSGDDIELALIRRPKWGDWSHPKGKLKRGEDPRQAAVRETLEETGMTCELGPELATLRYLVDDRPKEVRYWAAEATGGSFEPNDEVDRMVWLLLPLHAVTSRRSGTRSWSTHCSVPSTPPGRNCEGDAGAGRTGAGRCAQGFGLAEGPAERLAEERRAPTPRHF